MKLHKITKVQKNMLKDKMGKNVIVSIGINKYINDKDNLNNCENDAEKIYEVFKRKPELQMDIEKSQLLLSSQVDSVTSKKILFCVEEVCKTLNGNHNLIFYYSGHGVEVNGEFHFFTADSSIEDLDTLISIYRILDIAKQSKAKSIVMFIDACHTSVNGKKGIEDKSYNFNKQYLEESRGVGIMYSCSSGEYSIERYLDKPNSVFTCFLLEGLCGHVDALEEHYLSFCSLYKYISKESKQTCMDFQQIKQCPSIILEVKNDIYLALYNDEAACCDEINNSCKININNSCSIFESDEIRSKLKCLLNRDVWNDVQYLVDELIYNIYKNNPNAECNLEIGSNKLTIIDDGRMFNPIIDLKKNETNEKGHGIGKKTLDKFMKKNNSVKLEYSYIDNMNHFSLTFENRAFEIEELCIINVDGSTFLGSKIEEIKYLCDYYYYRVPRRSRCISKQRDICIDILDIIPQKSKLIVIDNTGAPELAIHAFGIDSRIIYSH